MKIKYLSWYQTGIISLIGIFFLGNRAINKEIKRRDLRVVQINMPALSRSDKSIMAFNLNVIDELKKKPQIRLSIDSLGKVGLIIRKYRKMNDTTNVLTVYWNDETSLQEIISLLDTLKRAEYKRYVIVPNEAKCMIPFYFPKPTNEFFDGNLGCCLPFYYPEPTKPFKKILI